MKKLLSEWYEYLDGNSDKLSEFTDMLEHKIDGLTFDVDSADRSRRFAEDRTKALETENKKLQKSLDIASISQEAMAEIEAVINGSTNQSIKSIVRGAISEVERYPEGFADRFQQRES